MLASAATAGGGSNLKVQQATSADQQQHQGWMRTQQLSGDGIQIMVNDVDLGQGKLKE